MSEHARYTTSPPLQPGVCFPLAGPCRPPSLAPSILCLEGLVMVEAPATGDWLRPAQIWPNRLDQSRSGLQHQQRNSLPRQTSPVTLVVEKPPYGCGSPAIGNCPRRAQNLPTGNCLEYRQQR